mmetsp:Transcript_25/g.49  ORF Transcript_25/g.49 Transcript_25/m.49 type:complete len:129 (+) Transcript_25:59-445(+)
MANPHTNRRQDNDNDSSASTPVALASLQSRREVVAWKQSTEQDRTTRRFMCHKLVKYLRKRDQTESASRRLAVMAVKIEEILYMSSLTRKEYLDPKTLDSRLQMISRGVVTLNVLHSAQQNHRTPDAA